MSTATEFGIDLAGQLSCISTRYIYNGPIVEANACWYNHSIPFAASFRACFEKAVLDYNNGIFMLYERNNNPMRIQSEETIYVDSEANINSVNAYYSEIKYFVNCVNEKKAPEVITIEENIKCLEILQKEIESLKSGEKIMV